MSGVRHVTWHSNNQFALLLFCAGTNGVVGLFDALPVPSLSVPWQNNGFWRIMACPSVIFTLLDKRTRGRPRGVGGTTRTCQQKSFQAEQGFEGWVPPVHPICVLCL